MTETASTPGLEPITGTGLGRRWFYRPDDRKILHYNDEAEALLPLTGHVPQMTGIIADLNEDGSRQIIAYTFIGRSGHRRIMTELEARRGTWARKDGQPRPSGPQAKKAFATIIQREAEKAEAAARETNARAGEPDGA